MKQHRESSGFALPTILIASVVMLIVLLSAIQTVAVTRLSVADTYYNQLAIEAAESGLMHAATCIRADANYNANWSASNPLNTGDNCSGTPIGGASTTVGNQTSPQKLETSYSVSFPNNTENPVTITSTGTVRLLKKSDSSVWRSYDVTRKMSLSRGIKSTQSIVSGSNISCGVFDYQTWCWGDNGFGQLGVNSTTDSMTPVRMHRLAGVLRGKQDVKVAAGAGATCVLTLDSMVYCAGRNSDYQMGVGSVILGYESRVPVAVDLSQIPSTDRGNLTDIVAGRGFFCVLGGGNVYCWGRNTFGTIGDGTKYTINPRPNNPVSGIGMASSRPVTKIATTYGSDNVCAIAGTSPRAYCWGRNTRGQIGDGTTDTRTTAVAVVSSSMSGNIVDIATGGGRNNGNTFGVEQYNDACRVIDDIEAPGNCGYPFTRSWYQRATSCAIASTGRVWCWGANQFGQLGTGSSPGYSIWSSPSTPHYASTTPVQVAGPLSTRAAVSLSASYGTMCALSNEATPVVYCWGHNQNGTLGRNLASSHTVYATPASVLVEPGVLGGKTITQIGGGVHRQCAIADDRTYCWGSNTNGQIGDGTTITRLKPTESTVLRQFHERPTIY